MEKYKFCFFFFFFFCKIILIALVIKSLNWFHLKISVIGLPILYRKLASIKIFSLFISEMRKAKLFIKGLMSCIYIVFEIFVI